jgi:hypothetical protein
MTSMFKRMSRMFSLAPQRHRENAYLNGSTSIVDLEMRMRDIDSGKFRSNI